MLWAFSAFLLVLCFLGLAGFYSLAAFFDVFLILAALISFFWGRSETKDSLLTRKSKT